MTGSSPGAGSAGGKKKRGKGKKRKAAAPRKRKRAKTASSQAQAPRKKRRRRKTTTAAHNAAHPVRRKRKRRRHGARAVRGGLIFSPGKGIWRKKVGTTTVGEGLLALLAGLASAVALNGLRYAGTRWRWIGSGTMAAGLLALGSTKDRRWRGVGFAATMLGMFLLATHEARERGLLAQGDGGGGTQEDTSGG